MLEWSTHPHSRQTLLWVNYYSHFYKSAMHNSLRRVDFHLRKWVRRKFKRFQQKPKGAREQPDTGSRMSREVHVGI
jgi:hypothetical protein